MENMGRIYRSAAEVIIWLGEDPDDHGHKAMAYIEHTATLICNAASIPRSNLWTVPTMGNVIHLVTRDTANFTLQTKPPEWKSLRWFFSRNWFTRLWVVQEANARPKVTACCGTNDIDWHAIALVSELFVLKPTADSERELADTFIWQAAAMRWYEYRHGRVLIPALDVSRNFLASDERDQIYALLGLPMFMDGPLHLKADYTKSMSEVYRDLAEAVISTSGTLDVLAYVQHEKDINIPSWVPRWNLKQQANVIFQDFTKWDACNKTPMSVSFDGMNLRIKGITLDLVSEGTSLKDFNKLFPLPGPDGSTSDEQYRRDFWRNQTLEIPSFQYRDWLEAYSMVFTWGISDQWAHTDKKEQGANFQDYLRTYCGDDLPFCEQLFEWRHKDGVERFTRTARTASWGRTLFKTKSGYIGQGPGGVQKGDILCIIYGCRMPMILRPEKRQYLLVGEAYVHEIMFGEATHKFRVGQLSHIAEEEFELH